MNPNNIDVLRRFVELTQTVDESITRTVETYGPQLEAIFGAIGGAILSLHAAQQQSLTLYPKLLAEVVPLAQRGWFVSGYFGLSEIMELASTCGTVTTDVLDARVADMYRSSLVEHLDSLARDYAARTFAIKPAVEAHTRGDYALSVPIFFVQAEGIFHDRENKYIFRKEDGRDIRDVAQDQLALIQKLDPTPYASFSRFMEIMWRPFADVLPIRYSEKDRHKHGYVGLNRHTILHGIALAEYATEENSLKAFSLLSHIGALRSE